MKSGKFVLYLFLTATTAFTFIFCIYAIKPTLHYHFQQIAWQTGTLFREYYLVFAGGPAEYLALFVSQFFKSNLAGSLIISVSGLILSFLILKAIDFEFDTFLLKLLVLPLIQIVVVALMCDYKFNFSVIINLIIVSGFLFLSSVFEKKTEPVILYHKVLTGVFIYYISGGIYFLIFILASIFLAIKRPVKTAVINVVLLTATAVTVPYLAHQIIFLTSLNNAYFRAMPDVAAMLRYEKQPLFYAGLAIIPVVILIAKILLIISESKKGNPSSGKKVDKSGNPILLVSALNYKWSFILVPQVFLLLITTGIIIYNAYNRVERKKIEIDFHAYNKNWEKVISLSKEVDKYDRMVNFQYNRALSNTGQLLEKLFTYEQKLGSQGLFLDKPFTSEVALPNSDIYFDLGNIDESQRFAFESETLMKNSPRVLKRLILNCFIMNKPEAASTYINILAANPMEKKWVKKISEYITNPDLIASDPLISQKRRDMNKTEGMLGTPPLKLLSQLEKNPVNKTAFEYLIAFDLMEHDAASLTEDLKFIGQFKYEKLPAALEEAIILFRTQVKNNELFNLIRISDSTSERFREFAKLTSAAKGDREKAKQATSAFKNTYWYYVLFLSPRVTNLKLETKPVDANY